MKEEDPSIRGPMSWSGERHAGFTSADKPFRPSVTNWKTHNVVAQQADPDSLLNWYRGLIALRNAEPALSIGSFTPLAERDAPIFAFQREHEGSRFIVLVNYAFRDAVLALPAGVAATRWEVAFPKGASLPFVPVKAGIKPGDKTGPSLGTAPAPGQAGRAAGADPEGALRIVR